MSTIISSVVFIIWLTILRLMLHGEIDYFDGVDYFVTILMCAFIFILIFETI